VAFAVLEQGKPFSRRGVSGRGKSISEREFSKLQKDFLDRGFAFRLNDGKNSRVLLSSKGEDYLSNFL
jgi:hypothetical protein